VSGARHIPAGSQTVGPFFRIGLEYLIERMPETPAGAAITIQGRVLDRDGAPVPDAMLEFWNSSETSHEAGFPRGFRRAPTNHEGHFSVVMSKPATLALNHGQTQAPHMLVLVFARGLLRHLISRVYFEGEPENESDPVLLAVPPERRRTLIAQRDGHKSFRWNVILQGPDETVFFAW
jgi:protocatechuate 3,4-dioxygenase, alpha subunit